ncbi:protein kinase domain-containing protein [Acrocarpospora corrugata]|uniref:protein kinase domain-containing protein n=1 Tax=Acrocarpospora corrugata TaxID=35763 RepID=UPI0012D34B00|nr:protein kinase [Acrocarpospora corrugata]
MTLLADRYRLLSPIGQGGMGTVWQAMDELLRQEVAIKEVLLPPDLGEAQLVEMRERTLREARAAARLRSHPSIVTVHDVVLDGGRPWIIMELIRGQSLDKLVRTSGPLPPQRVAAIGLTMLDALNAAHAMGILHRDVKPGNVLITDQGRVLLTDFGIATVQGDAQLTQTGVLSGSPGYMAPERLRGEPDGPMADLWSLGATLYTAVEGSTAFHRENNAAVMAAVLMHQPHPMRLAGPLAPVLAAILEKDPARRCPPGYAAAQFQAITGGSAPTTPAGPAIQPGHFAPAGPVVRPGHPASAGSGGQPGQYASAGSGHPAPAGPGGQPGQYASAGPGRPAPAGHPGHFASTGPVGQPSHLAPTGPAGQPGRFIPAGQPGHLAPGGPTGPTNLSAPKSTSATPYIVGGVLVVTLLAGVGVVLWRGDLLPSFTATPETTTEATSRGTADPSADPRTPPVLLKGNPEACDLLTPAQSRVLLGGPVKRQFQTHDSCMWTGPNAAFINLQKTQFTATDTTQSMFDMTKATMMDEPKRYPGTQLRATKTVGDATYSWTRRETGYHQTTVMFKTANVTASLYYSGPKPGFTTADRAAKLVNAAILAAH